jgi:hypothetical protein
MDIKEDHQLDKILSYLDFTKNDLNKYRDFKKIFVSDFDLMKFLFEDYYNSLVINKKHIEFHNFSFSYFSLALYAIERDLEYIDLLSKANYFKLLRFKSAGFIKEVKILSGNNSNTCESCKETDGKIFSLDYALEHMPLPNKNCTNDHFGNGKPWCRCTYLSVFD